jgi:hypothetical protein
MKKKSKLIAITVAASLVIGFYSLSGEEDDVNKAPEGYSYSFSNHLVPDIQIKLMDKSVRPLLNAMMNDGSGQLASYAIGYKYLISSLEVNTPVINNRPFIEYVNSDKESIKLQPKGLYTGVQYSGNSNLSRKVYDEVTFGFLAKWVKSKSPTKISKAVFGDVVSNDIAFPLAILYFQRQFLEQTEIKEFSEKYGYMPIFADYSYLYGEHIAKGVPFEANSLDTVKEKVGKNIIAISKYLDEQNKIGDSRVSEKAVFLLEFYLNEDMKMLKSLERDLRMITPPDNTDKEQIRIQRLEQEARKRQLEANEREKSERKSRRTPMS